MATLNSYLVFQHLRKEHPEDEHLKRVKTYGQKEFRLELAGKTTPDSEIPASGRHRAQPNPRHQTHVPGHTDARKRCVVCLARFPKASEVFEHAQTQSLYRTCPYL